MMEAYYKDRVLHSMLPGWVLLIGHILGGNELFRNVFFLMDSNLMDNLKIIVHKPLLAFY